MNEEIVPIEPISKTPIHVVKPEYGSNWHMPLTIDQPTQFTCGLAFNENLSRVLLIEKKRGPDFNVGLFNGIGGRIEIGEGIRSCMAREFVEETGIVTEPTEWMCFHSVRLRPASFKHARVYFMTTVLDNARFEDFASTTDEDVDSWSVADGFDNEQVFVYNMKYLVPMAVTWHRFPDRRCIEG